MTEPLRAQHIQKSELELLDSKVSRDGSRLRFLAGAEHGIATSIMEAEVPPGSGPRRHRHPYAELFVLHVGKGRFEVEGAYSTPRPATWSSSGPAPGMPS